MVRLKGEDALHQCSVFRKHGKYYIQKPRGRLLYVLYDRDKDRYVGIVGNRLRPEIVIVLALVLTLLAAAWQTDIPEINIVYNSVVYGQSEIVSLNVLNSGAFESRIALVSYDGMELTEEILLLPGEGVTNVRFREQTAPGSYTCKLRVRCRYLFMYKSEYTDVLLIIEN